MCITPTIQDQGFNQAPSHWDIVRFRRIALEYVPFKDTIRELANESLCIRGIIRYNHHQTHYLEVGFRMKEDQKFRTNLEQNTH